MIDLPTFDAFAIVLMVLLVLVIPLLGVMEFGLLARWVRLGRREARVRFYLWITVLEWTLATSLLAWWFLRGGEAAAIGLVPQVDQWQWLGVVGGLVLSLLVILQMNMILGSEEQLLKVRDSLGRLHFMAPRNNREQAYFLQVSLAAGICEEVLYRGLLTHVVSGWIGGYGAFLVVAFIFGLGHAYQGREGVLKSAAVGMLLGLLAWGSGSLYVAMILHAVLDFTSGRIMQAAVNLPAPPPEAPLDEL